MKYCSQCGAVVALKTPPADNRPRYICDSCETIHYQNPKVVAGCLVEANDGRILLCRRAIEPRYGYWTLPAGFMELGETTIEAALRETLEEAEARVQLDGLFAVFNLPHVDQVYMMFRSRLLDGRFGAGDESLEASLFSQDAIPWQELAFSTIYHTLRLYYEDQAHGRYRVHTGDIIKLDEGRYELRSGPAV
ncbi:ADP-ribose pyrophosphatase YjhB (NUDIX family) [Methylohalomonas lacus]|uniref:ADP-ribose pyrophosphatase YjhB (NUDIX family) n=1 Tax=Methylohalomonas lacus TaxID=398773 RepID=A0AAE3HLZ3_9GAMM|nr:NUDIX hydrolase [Methylohalomonas lacus]MCS3903382.1 ADP-ribose pyrophosphatase YjhB (NUDIX family) [Methylohalomonas lacus]